MEFSVKQWISAITLEEVHQHLDEGSDGHEEDHQEPDASWWIGPPDWEEEGRHGERRKGGKYDDNNNDDEDDEDDEDDDKEEVKWSPVNTCVGLSFSHKDWHLIFSQRVKRKEEEESRGES